MGGDYVGVSERLMKDDRIEKYLRKFLESTDYDEMMTALEDEDYERAFRAAHSIKGISLNLGFSGLQDTVSDLCEALRGGKPDIDISKMVEKVTVDYQKVISAIEML
jgi:HPt (histidine-containing phosphotransfer) domain-containing protein